MKIDKLGASSIQTCKEAATSIKSQWFLEGKEKFKLLI